MDNAGFFEALASSKEEVRIGLSEELASGVMDGATDFGTMLGSGILDFTCGAYTEARSSPLFFRLLARMVVHLLASGRSSLSDEDVQMLSLPILRE